MNFKDKLTKYNELLSEYNDIVNYRKYNSLEFFTPYPWQKEFSDKSKYHKQRYLRAGNQTGKTRSQGIEFAMHISGRYQDWYDGERIPDSGHIFWCIGIDLESTANVLQYELIGTKDIRATEDVGTGTIPRDCIDLNTMTKDGRRLLSVRIKHVDGGYNTLQFYGAAQGPMKLAGSRVKYIWCDEEPDRSEELWAQLVARTTSTEGWITLTATPEQGRSPLNVMFEEDTTGHLYLVTIGWQHCPHITPEVAERLLAGFPEYQRDMRSKGLPVLGSGAAFGFDVRMITYNEDVEIEIDTECLFAIDIAETRDDTVITFAVKKPNQGLVDDANNPLKDLYIIKEQYILNEDNKKGPEYAAEIINSHAYSKAPCVIPHDAFRKGASGYGSLLRSLGVNVYHEPFSNPALTSAAFKHTSTHSNSVEVGIFYMERFFRGGSLKIHKNNDQLLKEITTYHKQNNGKYNHSDTVDSARYCFVSLLANKGMRSYEAHRGFIEEDVPLIPSYG